MATQLNPSQRRHPVDASLPHNLDMERALLGSILLDNQCISVVDAKPEDMFADRHRVIFTTIMKLMNEVHPVDGFLVCDVLKREGLLEKAGGIAYLAGLTDGVPIGDHSFVQRYSRIVTSDARRRRLINSLAQASSRCFGGVDAVEDIWFTLSQDIAAINAGTSGKFHSLKEISLSVGSMEKLFGSGGVTGLPTGLTDLDGMTCGFQPGDLIILAAKSGCGKTAFALQFCSHSGIGTEEKRAIPVAVFSLEMPRQMLFARMICSEARVDSHRLRVGIASKEEWKKLIGATSKLYEAPIFIDDSSALEIGALCSRARNLKREKDIQLIVVDYLQLVACKGENRNLEVGAVARSLKALAKELEVPVVALSQLTYRSEGGRHRDRAPDLSMLRDSGEIEQHSDTVVFIHTPKKTDSPKNPSRVGVEFIVGKQRNGPTGAVRAVFVKPFVRFEAAMPDQEDEEEEETLGIWGTR